MGNYDRTMPYEPRSVVASRRTESARRRLGEICSPLFLFLTTFRRNSNTATLGVEDVRRRLSDLLDAIKDQCSDDEHLRRLLPEVWYTLVVTADQAMLSSAWNERIRWSMNLLETHLFGSAEGGIRFYEVVEEILARTGDDAAEVAEVLYTCMALGFQGELLGDRKRFERKRMALFEKARLAGSLGDALTPQAYGCNAIRPLVRQPRVGLMRVVIVGLVVILVTFIVGQGLASLYIGDTKAELRKLEGKARKPASAPAVR